MIIKLNASLKSDFKITKYASVLSIYILVVEAVWKTKICMVDVSLRFLYLK